jgi:hypothetical protein
LYEPVLSSVKSAKLPVYAAVCDVGNVWVGEIAQYTPIFAGDVQIRVACTASSRTSFRNTDDGTRGATIGLSVGTGVGVAFTDPVAVIAIVVKAIGAVAVLEWHRSR